MTTTQAQALAGAAFFSGKNRIINGLMAVDQRNNGGAQAITAAAALAYTVDRWYAYCTGASVIGQQGTGQYVITGNAGVTGIGFGQRIEAKNSLDLANNIATLSVSLSNTLLNTVTWTAYYANTTDTFGTLAAPTKTQIATGSFNVNSTYQRYSAQIAIPGAATTGIEIVFSVGAQISGNWRIGGVQLEYGSKATVYEYRDVGDVQRQCYRYRQQNDPTLTSEVGNCIFSGNVTSGSVYYAGVKFPVTMRASPTIVLGTYAASNFTLANAGYTAGPDAGGFVLNNTAIGTGQGAYFYGWSADAEL